MNEFDWDKLLDDIKNFPESCPLPATDLSFEFETAIRLLSRAERIAEQNPTGAIALATVASSYIHMWAAQNGVALK